MKRQTAEDRRHESEGMRRYEESRGESDYSWVAGERHMISEDRSAPANLPQHVVHGKYKDCEYIDEGYYDDSRAGIDRRTDEEVRKIDHSMRKQGKR